ncbi:conserved hypothetical protein [Altererythrobacter sp. B11]|uniref:hypothetical protein n=1 Tax=Altererythrobacter sp. B11 TaxID=2060312 RepID=UPI000DC730E5|nr:hypothetical protein [Altererythrobacter sp. B11]BBC72370.1 conserved hypothetical protein [Altererythrobacter sp. B11]
MTRARAILKAGFVLLCAVIFWLAVRPGSGAPTLGWDKLDHMAAFLVLAAYARVAWPRGSAVAIVLSLALFGGLIEIAQWQMGWGRDGDVMDWIADVAATLAGLALGTLACRLLPRWLTTGG